MMHVIVEMFEDNDNEDSNCPSDELPFKTQREWELEGELANLKADEDSNASKSSAIVMSSLRLPCSSDATYNAIEKYHCHECCTHLMKKILKAHHKKKDVWALHSSNLDWDQNNCPCFKEDALC